MIDRIGTAHTATVAGIALALLAGCGGTAGAESTIPDPPAVEEAAPAGERPTTETTAEEPAREAPGAETTAGTTPAAAGPAPIPAQAPAEAARATAGNGRLVIGQGEMARGRGRINGRLLHGALERKRGGILTCYNVALGGTPALAGELVVMLVIDPQGMVGVRVEQDDAALQASGVTSCVVAKLRTVSFQDHPPGGELWVRVPLRFQP